MYLKIFAKWINECLKYTDDMLNAKLGILGAGVIRRKVDEGVEGI